MAPPRTINCVGVHVLRHLRHAGHSRAFWKLLGLQLPGWLEHKE